MPARFEHDRVFVDVAGRGGDLLQFYTDTGGGLFVYGDAADRVGWQDPEGIQLSEFSTDRSFPDPLGSPDHRVPTFRPEDGTDDRFDGMLGQAWFADRIWTFDYAAKKLLMHSAAPTLEPGVRTIEMGFRTDDDGVRILSFPRITAVVDGETLDMLFDTGATVHLSSEARRRHGESAPVVQAASFVTSEVLRRWRARHPDWPTIANADEKVGGMTMILVPEVSIADFAVGPVWFTERPDANFHEYMSQWMDRQVDGALGGNLFRFFRITVDYPAAAAHFARVTDPG